MTPAAQPASEGRAAEQDEGPGETEGVSPGAISIHKAAPDESGAWMKGLGCFLSCRIFLCRNPCGCWLRLV